MPIRFLFCIDESAKEFACQVANMDINGNRTFYLVESRSVPRTPEDETLADLTRGYPHDPRAFHSDFFGRSIEECQEFSQSLAQIRNIENAIIGVVDARGAQDGTILFLRYWSAEYGSEPMVFGRYGPLPPRIPAWYTWRIYPKWAFDIAADLTETSPLATYPVYFGNKQRFTNDQGIFDVEEAIKYMSRPIDHPEVAASGIHQW